MYKRQTKAALFPFGGILGRKYFFMGSILLSSGISAVLWTAAAVTAAAVAAGLVIFIIKRDFFKSYVKHALAGAVILLAALGIVILSLNLAKSYSTDYISYVLIPLSVLCGAVLCSAAALICMSKFKPENLKRASYISGAVLLVILIAAAVMIGIYYGSVVKDDGYYNNSDSGSEVNDLALYLLSGALAAAVIASAFIFGRNDKTPFNTRSIAYAGVCIALSFALSYISIIHMPQGGSVTAASLLPLMLYSHMFGVKKGVFAGFVYGLLQAVQDPWIIHPAQFLLDYPIAFAMIGLSGIFTGVRPLDKVPQLKFAFGAAVASVLRYTAHVFSGVFAFSAYAQGSGMSPWIYSLAYNSFVFVDIAIVIAAGVLIFSSRSFISFISRFQPGRPGIERGEARTQESIRNIPAEEAPDTEDTLQN